MAIPTTASNPILFHYLFSFGFFWSQEIIVNICNFLLFSICENSKSSTWLMINNKREAKGLSSVID